MLVGNGHAKRRTGVPASEAAAFQNDSDQTPYKYLYGSVSTENLIQDRRGQFATNVAFQPRYASELFVESVLFCGNRAQSFNTLDGPVVVTYRRLSHQLIEGVPCFDLISVDRVEGNGEISQSHR